MPTRLLGSTTLLFRDGERLADSVIEPFSLRVAGTCRPSTLPLWMKNKNPSALYSVDQRLKWSGGRLQMTERERLPEYGGHNAPKQP
jgi:hypothetical protein